jgi:GT2 family glycosyltransferase
VRKLIELNVYKIIIVDNNSTPESKVGFKLLARQHQARISVITLSENKGSAGGFKCGLQFAHSQADCQFIWLLDDDNLPESNALTSQISSYQNRASECCLISLRKTRATYRNIRNETDVKRKFKPKNSFIHFSLRHYIFKRLLHSFDTRNQDMIAVPYGPYGGMFFRKTLLDTIGYPNEKMFLYMDDHEFSHRIVKAGLTLFLNRKSIINDMEVSWPGKKKNRFFSRFMTAVNGDETKVFYLIRNSIYLERKHFVTNTWEYSLNRMIYKVIFYSLCIVTNNRGRIELFDRASAEAQKMEPI